MHKKSQWHDILGYIVRQNKQYLNAKACTKPTLKQAWGQSTRYFGTLVLEYRFCSTRRYSVLVLFKSTCTHTCTQVLLTSTYEYYTSTSHLKLIQNSSQTNHKSL